MTYKKVLHLEQQKKDNFAIRNNIQVFYASTLALVYAQRTIFKVFLRQISNWENSPEKTVATRLLSLYGGNILMKHLGLLYEVKQMYNKHKQNQTYLTLKFRVVTLLDPNQPRFTKMAF